MLGAEAGRYCGGMFSCEPVGRLAVMRFDRAEKKNALLPQMLASLVSAIDTASSAHVIVLSGVGSTFCSGFDLSSCRDDPSAAVLRELLVAVGRACEALRRAPCPVVVSAHGAAIAGGCALAASSDFVVTHADAKLGYPVVKLGISPAISGPALATAIGGGPTRARLLDSGLISGTEAARIGLAHECVATLEGCEVRAVELAQELAAKPRHALGYTKRWLNEIDGSTHADELVAAVSASLALVGSPEQRELLARVWAKG